ncbi:NADH-cytochrome b5 reductase-like isoform X2 [Rhipicephalus microplus]|uniref:NADH-cytochrome b5 reductase-like isoform X2 n=1 Tax=Rhipicephalus microplus TaxID=6941 RepID=UPI003F6CDAA0
MAENNNKPLPPATISEEMLARKPRQPTAAECCGDGCAVCVYDIYAQELTIWENECKRELQYGSGRRELVRALTWRACVTNVKARSRHANRIASVDGEIVTRQYTPVSLASALGFFEVIIKVYPTGKMSKYIRTLKEGCSVEWRGPLGRLDYKPNMHKHMLMLAAGTGIAPMVQVLRHITSMDDDYTMVHLLFGMAKYRDIYLKDELDELKRFWNVSILYCLSDEAKVQDIKYGDEVHCGEIDEELLEAELTKRSIPHVLLCGPSAFNNRFVKYLKSRTDPVTWHVF